MAEKKKPVKTKKKKGKKLIQVRSEAKHLRISPRKLKLVVDQVKKLSPSEALSRLRVWNKKGAGVLLKAINTVMADAENNFNLDKEKLRFKEILVNEAVRLKRMDKSHGARFNSGLKQKKMSHLRIIVEGEKEE